jgi:circadian clock protein KaiB
VATAIAAELFVRGQSSQSVEAVARVRSICDRLAEGYFLEVIDVHQRPERARERGVTVTPTLIRYRPEPVLRTVGPLSDDRIIQGLGLGPPKETHGQDTTDE